MFGNYFRNIRRHIATFFCCDIKKLFLCFFVDMEYFYCHKL